MGREAVAAGLRELAARGFSSMGYVGEQRMFRGTLASPRGPLSVAILIQDWDFLEYPTIIVTDGMKKFPQLRPHLDVHGGLCYFSRRSVVLDRYDAGTAVAQCLEQAQAVLGKILDDRNYVVRDIQNEFLVHWDRAEPPAMPVYLVGVALQARSARIHFDQAGNRALLSDNAAEAQALASCMGWGQLSEAMNRCWLFRSDKLPPVPDHFPAAVEEFFSWLRQWDQRLSHAIQHHFATDAAYEYERLVMAVHMPAGWIGVMFAPRPPGKLTCGQMKAYLHGRGGSTPIQRLTVTDVSAEFVHSRNLSFKNLTGKRITLVGCGAIGSQLAPALVRLGAGQGQQGLLRLVDEEDLMAENLGRHYLGYNRLGQPKACALRDEIERQFPLAKLDDLSKAVQDLRLDVMRDDLLIDATGDQAVSEFLNGQWLDAKRPLPVLYVWIKGNGECVQSLWCAGQEDACFHCLRVPDADVYRKDRHPVLKRAPELKRLGCHAFTPYAVSSGLHAAALATDVICDWLQGRMSPRFRTRCRENVDVHHVASMDLPPLSGCLACTPH